MGESDDVLRITQQVTVSSYREVNSSTYPKLDSPRVGAHFDVFLMVSDWKIFSGRKCNPFCFFIHYFLFIFDKFQIFFNLEHFMRSIRFFYFDLYEFLRFLLKILRAI